MDGTKKKERDKANKGKKHGGENHENTKDAVQTSSVIPRMAEIKKFLTAFFKARPKREDLEAAGILVKEKEKPPVPPRNPDALLSSKTVTWNPQLTKVSQFAPAEGDSGVYPTNIQNNTPPNGSRKTKEEEEEEKKWREQQLDEMRMLDMELESLNNELVFIEQKLEEAATPVSPRSAKMPGWGGGTSPPSNGGGGRIGHSSLDESDLGGGGRGKKRKAKKEDGDSSGGSGNEGGVFILEVDGSDWGGEEKTREKEAGGSGSVKSKVPPPVPARSPRGTLSEGTTGNGETSPLPSPSTTPTTVPTQQPTMGGKKKKKGSKREK